MDKQVKVTKTTKGAVIEIRTGSEIREITIEAKKAAVDELVRLTLQEAGVA